MTDAYDKLIAAQKAVQSDSFAVALSNAPVRVVSVDRDSTGRAIVARGTIGGQGDFPVEMGGRNAEVGETILAGYPVDAPAGSVGRYLGHLQSDYADPGGARVIAGPPPAFGTTGPNGWWGSTPNTQAGASFVTVTIYFTPIEAKWNPSGYMVSFRPAGQAGWTDLRVPLQSPVGTVNLPFPLAPGTTVDVKLRTEFSWAYGNSPESATQTLTTPVSTASPGSISALAVQNVSPGHFTLRPTLATNSLFKSVQYLIATDGAGSGLQTFTIDGGNPLEFFTTAGGNFYYAAQPISIYGVAGSRFPSSGFLGPVAVPAAPVALDTTAPPTWTAPTLAMRGSVLPNGSTVAFLKVTFPAYAFPSDYDYTVVRLYNGTTYDEWVVKYTGVAPDPIERSVDFGSYSVTLRGVDKTGNMSLLGPAGTVALAKTGIPGVAAAPTISQVGLALKIDFVMPTGSNTVVIQRATNAAMTTGLRQWETVGTYDLDLFTDTSVPLATYYYRIWGRNLSGDGTPSTVVSGTVQPLTGSFLGAATVQGDRIVAGTIDAARLNANLTITSILKTAVSGARWEIEGATGGANANGIRLYGDDGVVSLSLARDVNGRGRFTAGKGNVYITDAEIYMNINSANIRWRAATQEIVVSGSNFLGNESIRFYNSQTNPYIMYMAYGGDGRAMALMPYGLSLYHPGYNLASLEFLASNLYLYAASLVVALDITANRNMGVAGTIVAGSTIRGAGGVLAGTGGLGNYAPNGFTGYDGSNLGNNTGDRGYKILGGSGVVGATNQRYLNLQLYRFQPSGGWYGSVWRLYGSVDQDEYYSGFLDIGATNGGNPYWGLGISMTAAAQIYWSGLNNRIETATSLYVGGTLSAASKAFSIPHPDPAKPEMQLRHSTIESPTAGDTLYRYTITVPVGKARQEVLVPLPSYWKHLNENPQVLVAPIRLLGSGWGDVDAAGENVVVNVSLPGKYLVWVFATRKDPAAVAAWKGAEVPLETPGA